jgi:NAD(P)-dependent dehydrogenase (short-subunit alcohol dehydrogenase family)
MTIFLTGGNGGIGSTIVDVLKKANIEVISPSSIELNLNKEFDVTHYPEIDGFIHCAGANDLKSHDNVVLNELYNIFKINTISFIELCGQLKFKNNSNIIAIGSLYATMTKENRIQYATSKHALLGAVKTIALEKASNNIKVNMVSPGFVDTPLTRQNNSQERINYLNQNIPLGLTNPLEIANFCLYLIQYNNSITGQNINIDGGYTLKGL